MVQRLISQNSNSGHGNQKIRRVEVPGRSKKPAPPRQGAAEDIPRANWSGHPGRGRAPNFPGRIHCIFPGPKVLQRVRRAVCE